MGIEIPAEYGGTDSSFFVACLVIEEIAKLDPSVSVMVDIHNTLIKTLVMRLGTQQQKDHYLPRLATDMVRYSRFQICRLSQVTADFVRLGLYSYNNTNGFHKMFKTVSGTINNYSPKWRWVAVNLYRAASAR